MDLFSIERNKRKINFKFNNLPISLVININIKFAVKLDINIIKIFTKQSLDRIRNINIIIA